MSSIRLSMQNGYFYDYGKKHESVGYAPLDISTYDTNEPLFLTFCWIVDDEIYVGKLITIYAEIEKPILQLHRLQQY